MELPIDPVVPCAGPPTGEVALTRTSTGWAVVSPAGRDDAGDLVEGMTLADLVSEELGSRVEPDRSARRSARGPATDGGATEDPRDARIVALERTVAQLEHALAARVSIERAIGVLAERNGTAPRTAFDELRGSARSQGRPVADLAREVLESLAAEPEAPSAQPAAALVTGSLPRPAPRPHEASHRDAPHRDAHHRDASHRDASHRDAHHRDAHDSVAGGRR